MLFFFIWALEIRNCGDVSEIFSPKKKASLSFQVSIDTNYTLCYGFTYIIPIELYVGSSIFNNDYSYIMYWVCFPIICILLQNRPVCVHVRVNMEPPLTAGFCVTCSTRRRTQVLSVTAHDCWDQKEEKGSFYRRNYTQNMHGAERHKNRGSSNRGKNFLDRIRMSRSGAEKLYI